MATFVAVQLITYAFGAAAAGGALLTATAAAIQIAAAVAISYAAAEIFSPASASKGARAGVAPSDRTFLSRSATAPRTRSYGRVKLSGSQQFAAAKGGKLYRVLAHGEGPIDAVEEHWIDDNEVTFDGSGDILTAQYLVTGSPRVQAFWTLGTTTGLHYSQLEAEFDEWDTGHLGKGVHHSLLVLTQVAQASFSETFPNYESTNYAQTIRGAKIYDPRDAAQDIDDNTTWLWSMNAPLCIMDFLTHKDGLEFPWAFVTPEIEAWEAAADVADEAVPLKAGGTTPRYQLSGTYGFNERKSEILERMMSACDARMITGQNGGLALSMPSAAAPTVTITDDAVLSYRIGSGNEAPDTATVVKSSYLEAEFGYVETDAQPWENATLAAKLGEIVSDIPLNMVPTHSQARRLMKLAAARLAPAWRGEITTNLLALPAISERYVQLQIAELDLDIRVELEGVQFQLGEGSTVSGLSIQWVAADASELDWDALTEEGRIPERGAKLVIDNSLPTPAGLAITIVAETFGASTYPVAVANWTDIGVDSLDIEVAYQVVGNLAGETTTKVSSDNNSLSTGALLEGSQYQFTVRSVGQSDRVSATSAAVLATANIDTAAPAAAGSITATVVTDDVTVEWTQPTSANTAGAKVFRNTVDNFGTATEIASVAGGASTVLSYVDSDLAADEYWYWVETYNASLFAGAEAAAASSATVA